MEVLYSLFTTLQVIFQLLSCVLIIFLFNFISQALEVFIVYIKDFLKLLFVLYIAIIISFYYLFLYITALYSINIYLAGDFFSNLEADLQNIEGFIYLNIVWEVYYNYPSVYCQYRVQAILFIIPFLFRSIYLYIFQANHNYITFVK